MSAYRQPTLERPPSPPKPSRRYRSLGYRAKTLLLGPALTTSQLTSERVSKRIGLAVFSSDPISSTAYATEEILLVLVGGTLAGGVLATGLALPVALAIAALLALVVAGVWRLARGDIGPIGYTPEQARLLHSEGAAGAVTAKKTLMVMAAIMGTLFLGITWLAVRLEARPFDRGYPTVISQIARQVLGSGPAFIVVQAATLLILVLAANTAFSGFPLLASFASGDALLPRQLRKRGHRLVYSNGILVNGIGAVVTLVALMVIVVGKFTQGAWMVLIEDLDQAALSALQYARQLNPLSITAMHIVVDPDHARELGRLWSKVHIPFPLELVDAPDRNLLATVEEAVGELVRPDTEVTVLIPRRRYVGFWRRVLHDQTSAGLTAVLGAMENVNVTIVPFHLAGPPQPRLHAVRGT